MTKKEQARMERLERENAYLRERLDRHMAAYREQLYEIVDLRATLDAVRDAMGVEQAK